MKKINIKNVRRVIVITAYIVLAFLCVTFFRQFKMLVDQNYQYEVEKLLYQDASHYSRMVRNKVNEYYGSMNDSLITFYDEDNISGFIKKYVDDNENIKAAKVIVDNKDYTYNAQMLDDIDDEFIKMAYEGNKIVRYVDDGHQTEGFVYAIPISKNNKIIGIYEVLQSTGAFEKILIEYKYYPLVTHALINEKGVKFFGGFLINSDEKYESFLKRIKVDDATIKSVKEKLNNNEFNVIKYKYDGKHIYACYAPVGINDWYLVAEIDSESVKNREAEMIKVSTELLVKEVLIIAILFSHVIYMTYRSRVRTNRVNKKLNKLNDDLKISNERYELIIRLSKSMIFEYNYNDDRVYVTADYVDTFGENLKEIKWVSNSIYDGVNRDDIAKFSELKNLKDDEYKVIEFRKQNSDGEIRWYRLYARCIFDEKMNPVKLIGRIDDVNKEVIEKVKLKRMAESDTFTGFFNKEATRKYIVESLEKYAGKKHAFIIIDIDNLKIINDKLGHIAGDKAIKHVSEEIKSVFRYDDIVGRIGGDEFVVLMKNINSKESVEKKLNILCDQLLQSEYTEQEKVTVSIGVSFYPMNAISYRELYKKADSALYNSKKSGKNEFSFYKLG